MTEAKLKAWLDNPASRKTLRGKIALYLQEMGYATTEVLSIAMGKSINTTAARLTELEAQGCVTPMYNVSGYTLWRWEYDSEQWGINVQRRANEKALRKLTALLDVDELSTQFKAAVRHEIALLEYVNQKQEQ
jgi:hypothetical protein